MSQRVVASDPPDGGFGWVVVVAGFLNHILILGMAYTVGVFYPTFQDAHELNADSSTVAWVGTANLCMHFCSGPLAGYLLTRRSTLVVAFVGSLIAGSGCIMAAFSQNIYLVILCFGLVGGTGTGLMFMSTVTSVSRWFSSKRSLATGLAVSGAGFGVFAFSPLIRLMIQEWGRKEALLIEGAVMLNGCVFALLLRPVPPTKKQSVNVIAAERGVTFDAVCKSNDGDDEKEMEELVKPTTELKASETRRKSVLVPVSRQLSSSGQMWRDVKFWFFLASQFFTFFAASGPLVYLFSRANLDLGIDGMRASFIVSLTGVFNTIGRIALAGLGNLFPAWRLYLLSASIVAFGAATTLCTLGESYMSLAVFAAVFGTGYGSMFALTTVVLVDLFGLAIFQTSYGSVGFFRGIAIISAPPLYGVLIGLADGQHYLLFVVTGILGVLGGALLLLIPIYDCIRTPKLAARLADGEK